MTTEHDALFQEWLGAMHPRLARFEDVVMPRGWRADHTRASLAALEQHLLDRWPDRRTFEEEQDTDFTDGATRYIGETYLRLGGGGWFVDRDPRHVFSGRPFVRLDTLDRTSISPLNLMTTLLARRTGQVLTRVWDGQTKQITERRGAEGVGWQPRREPVPGLITEARPTSPELDAWVASIDGRIEALRSRAGASGADGLDLGLASLAAVEQLVLSDGGAGAKPAAVAYIGEVARRAAGGDWVLLPGPADHANPFVGRPFVERLDSEGDWRRLLLDPLVDRLLKRRETDLLDRVLRTYAA
jgi:hypothetical protein